MIGDMPFADDRLDDFNARWKQAFGEELTRDQAKYEADRVLHLYRRMLTNRRVVGDVTAHLGRSAYLVPVLVATGLLTRRPPAPND